MYRENTSLFDIDEYTSSVHFIINIFSILFLSSSKINFKEEEDKNKIRWFYDSVITTGDSFLINTDNSNESIIDSIKHKSMNGIITSPPYNLGNGSKIGKTSLYKNYKDSLKSDCYIKRITETLKLWENKIIDNGVMCINLSYGSNDPSLPFKLILNIQDNTNWKLLDTIVWKKYKVYPISTTANTRRLSRKCEFVFIFCKKGSEKSYQFNNNRINEESGKKKVLYNIIETGYKHPPFLYKENNLNHIMTINEKQQQPLLTKEKFIAAYTEELVENLIDLYFKKGDSILDLYSGSGTTAVCCKRHRIKYIALEIDKEYFTVSKNRLTNIFNKNIY